MDLTPAALMMKARRALASAHMLLDAGDVDGACNRAYYAMFDAARAALFASEAPVAPDVARTHGGLINAFGHHLVKNGPMPREIGRLLNRAEEIRLVADYNGDSVSPADTRDVVENAGIFPEEVQERIIHEHEHDRGDDFDLDL